MSNNDSASIPNEDDRQVIVCTNDHTIYLTQSSHGFGSLYKTCEEYVSGEKIESYEEFIQLSYMCPCAMVFIAAAKGNLFKSMDVDVHHDPNGLVYHVSYENPEYYVKITRIKMSCARDKLALVHAVNADSELPYADGFPYMGAVDQNAVLRCPYHSEKYWEPKQPLTRSKSIRMKPQDKVND